MGGALGLSLEPQETLHLNQVLKERVFPSEEQHIQRYRGPQVATFYSVRQVAERGRVSDG